MFQWPYRVKKNLIMLFKQTFKPFALQEGDYVFVHIQLNKIPERTVTRKMGLPARQQETNTNGKERGFL